MAAPYEETMTPIDRGATELRRTRLKTVAPASPLLSICIPTRNRSARTLALVEHLVQLLEPYGGAVEVVVSDNNSNDETIASLTRIKVGVLRLHRQEKEHPTAEGHVFAAAKLCHGAYVWFLGDDDIPVEATLRCAMQLLEEDQHDFLFFNSILIDEFSGLTGGSVARLNSELVRLNFAKGAVAIGLMSGFAGLSNSIMRRERLTEAAWSEIPERSIIYAHVAWWLICFDKCHLTVVNRPLVRYRVSEGTDTFARFQALAITLNCPDHHFWGEGLIDLLILLEQRRILDSTDIAAMFESRRDGNFGRALDDIAYAIFRQAVESIVPLGHRNRIAGPVLDKLTAWLERIDPSFHECVQVIRRIYALRPDPAADQHEFEGASHSQSGAGLTLAQLEEEFRRLHAHLATKNTPLVGLVSISGPFKIFSHLVGYVAIREDLLPFRQDVLRTIDPCSERDTVIVAASLPLVFELLRTVTPCPKANKLEASPNIIDEKRLEAALIERDSAVAELNAIRNSTFWRMFGPLRRAISAMRSVR